MVSDDTVYTVTMALGVKVSWRIMKYLRRQQATIAEYVAGRPIYELYTDAKRMDRSRRFLRWRYQEHGLTQVEREVG